MGCIFSLNCLSAFEHEIVILTKLCSITTAVNAIKMGATNYLPKPATVEQMLQAFEGELLDDGEDTTVLHALIEAHDVGAHTNFICKKMMAISPQPPVNWACTVVPYSVC